MGECLEYLNQDHPCALFSGDTGSGKSISALAYAHYLMKQVFMTQPRKMAAAMVAEPVADYLLTPVGGEVGYQTAMEANFSDDTTTHLRTDGLLLRQYLKYPEVFDQEGNVIILDEQHERNVNMDVLLALFLMKNHPRYGLRRAKLIVMSATANVMQLKKYFWDTLAIDIRHFESAGRTKELRQHFGPANEYMPSIFNAVEAGKNVLAFRPSQNDCEQTADAVRQVVGDDVDVYAVYATQRASVREAAMAPTKEGRQKVVVSTNVSQTSITPLDIQVVVDDAMEIKPIFQDGMSGIKLDLASKSDVLQRAGRVGRVEDGDAYYCCDTGTEELQPYPEPPILTSDLSGMYLLLTAYGISFSDLTFMDRPTDDQLSTAENYLKKINAITSNNCITNAGTEMLNYPLDPPAARMLVESKREHYNVNVMRYALAMSALVSDQGIIDKNADIWKDESLESSFSDIFSHTKFFLKSLKQVKDLEGEEREDALIELGIKPQRFERAWNLYQEICKREMESAQRRGETRLDIYKPMQFVLDVHSADCHQIEQCIIAAYWPYLSINTSKGLYCTLTRKSLEFESNSVLKDSTASGSLVLGVPFLRDINDQVKHLMIWATKTDLDRLDHTLDNFYPVYKKLEETLLHKEGVSKNKGGKGHGKKDFSRNRRNQPEGKKHAKKSKSRTSTPPSHLDGKKKLCSAGQGMVISDVVKEHQKDVSKRQRLLKTS